MSSIPNSAMPHAGGTTSTNSQQPQDAGTSSGSRPGDYASDTFYSVRERDNGTLLERAREHKTGIAVGVAVGAIAAAAIPFMLSGKKRSGERQQRSGSAQSDLYVDARDTTGVRTGGRS